MREKLSLASETDYWGVALVERLSQDANAGLTIYYNYRFSCQSGILAIFHYLVQAAIAS